MRRRMDSARFGLPMASPASEFPPPRNGRSGRSTSPGSALQVSVDRFPFASPSGKTPSLGFPHEHLRKEIIDKIDRQKAIDYFMATQGWSEKMVIAQVLTPIKASALIATEEADEESIMCYGLPADIMLDGKPVPGGTDIDENDRGFIAQHYPLEVQAVA